MNRQPHHREDKPLPRRIRNRIAAEYREAPQRYAQRWAAAQANGGAAMAHFGERVAR